MVGQSMIVRIPTAVYTIRAGDTLDGIAQANNVTVDEILRNNPWAQVKILWSPVRHCLLVMMKALN